jgi:outer membrane protein OmpA-like peptidoglycan-associated protein
MPLPREWYDVTNKLMIAALLASLPAWAPSAGAQTAEQLACQLSGACGDASTDEVVQEAVSEAETPEASTPQARVSATRGFSIARKVDQGKAVSATQTASPKAAVTASRKKTVGAPGKSTKSAGMLQSSTIGRADLRVSFVSGSAEMTPAGQREAMKFVQALQMPMLQSMRFIIAGHTDAVGNREYNLDLSRRRAQAMVDYLVANGADRSRFDVQGFGFDKPMPGSAATSPENRRVEIIRIK